MTRRPQPTSTHTVGVRWLALAFSFVLAMAMLLVGSPAGAAGSTDNAQISLTGLVDGNNPAGGSELGIHPGDSIKFTASAAPTAKVKDLADSIGIGGLLGSLLGTTNFQVTADFSRLPGGSTKTVLSGSKSKTFRFPSVGTYVFTWTADKVTVTSVPLLGTQTTLTPIKLDGNQAKQAGVELNAEGQYVGKIVVAKNPPQGGISVQLPKVSVQPNLPVVGKLPKITIPGVTLPTIKVAVPKLSSPKSGKQANGSGGSAAKPGTGLKYTPPGLTVPEEVVPGAHANEVYGSGGGSYNGLPNSGTSQAGNGSNQAGTNQNGSAASGSKSSATQNSTGKNKTIDLASDSPSSPSSSLPLILALISILALAIVAGTYARLFLLRKN
ncbi:MAG: hypothetical protein ABI345_09385 [Jatrophihabitans sp.]